MAWRGRGGSPEKIDDLPEVVLRGLGVRGESPDEFSPTGVKGLGEIGLVGLAAAIANAVYHATGRRIRSLPITVDQLLATQEE